jgi:hypothetical protein
VAAEELGDAVDDDVGIEVEWSLPEGRRESVVDDDGYAAFARAGAQLQ